MIVCGDERCPHGDLGFAEPNITAHETVHDFFGTHIGSDSFDGSGLIRCLLEIEALAEFGPSALIELVRIANARFTLRVDL